MYLLLCEDSNGQSEIVAVCLLVSEDVNSMKWMLDVFRKHNVQWSHARVILADKDIKERQIVCLMHLV